MNEAPAFWQEILIRAFRLPIRLAFSVGRPSLKDLQNLMRTAAVSELSSQGLSTREIAVALDVSETWVIKLGHKAATIGGLVDEDAYFVRVLRRLRQGPATAAELAALMPLGATFHMDRVAVALLVREGMIEEVGPSRTFHLTPRFRHLSDRAWGAPTHRLERLHLQAIRILLVLLTREALGEAEIEAALEREGNRQGGVGEALALLRDQALISCDTTSDPPRFSLEGRHLKLIPTDHELRVRTGLLTMLDHLAIATTHILASEGRLPYGQRTLLFRATPRALERFIGDHHRWVMERLAPLDREGESSPEGRPSLMVWTLTTEDGAGGA